MATLCSSCFKEWRAAQHSVQPDPVLESRGRASSCPAGLLGSWGLLFLAACTDLGATLQEMRLSHVCVLWCSGVQNKPGRVQTAPRSGVLALKGLSFEIPAEAEYRIWGLSTLGITECSVTSVFVPKTSHSLI